MNTESIIIIGGVYSTSFAIFHLLFWKIFKWKEDLRSLSAVNRAIMQVLNLSLTFGFLIFAYISFFHSSELLTTSLGKSLLILISLFWFLRAIEQIIFFKLNSRMSVLFFAIFLVGGLLYLFPFVQ